MAVLPSWIVNEERIEAAVRKAERAVRSQGVLRIRYSLGEDATDDEAIFFRVLLTDKAGRRDKIFENTQRISQKIEDIVDPRDRFGLLSYFKYRTASEQEELKEAKWE
jgi:hypothetical protein